MYIYGKNVAREKLNSDEKIARVYLSDKFKDYEIINNAILDNYELEKTRNDKLCNIKKSHDIPLNIAIDTYKTHIFENSPYSISNSVLEKTLKCQNGINDEFLKLYFSFKEFDKVVTSFGQGHLNAINPNTRRIHTVYRAIGAASGRMSCGSKQPNTDLAKYKHISPNNCKQLNLQQLPNNKETPKSP